MTRLPDRCPSCAQSDPSADPTETALQGPATATGADAELR